MGLTLKEVSKSFGTNKAVDKVSLTLDTPGVYGLLGTNGAGKTTIIRMLLGIINNDSGEITWNDKKVSRETVNFGYLPEERGVYQKIKIRNQLMYFGELKGMKKEDIIASIDKWSKKLKVEQYMNMTADKLSKGNQQKIQFMIAILHNPELVVLDEPFSGLDPVNSELLKNIIVELVKDGKYVIMSAHQMQTIEEFCENILILNKGKTVLQGNLSEIKEGYPANRLSLNTKQDVTKYIEENDMEIEVVANNNYKIKINNEEKAHKLLKDLIDNNIVVNKFEIQKPTLKKKAFIVSTIIMILMIILASAFTKIIPKLADSNEKDKILIVDNDNIFENQLNTMNELGLNNEFIIAKEKTSLADVKTKIKNKDIKKGIIISKAEGKIKIEYVVENTSLMMNSPVDIQKALKEIYSQNQLKKLNLTQQQIQSLEPNFEYTIVSSQEKDANKNITVILALTGLLFAAIYTFAYQVSTSITTEKTSKIVETLVTYTKARNIVLGKTFGIGLAGLIQLLIIAIISIFSINTFVDKNMLSAFLDLSTITPALGITIVVYFILGYMEYALLYALTGSFVSNPEEVKAAATPASLIAVMSFYLAYFTIMSPTRNLNSIASIVPFSSPFSAPFRVMLGVATPREMIMSVLILIATNILIAHIAIKVYTNAIINNGTKLSLKEIIKMYKTK